jgi:hypothetical protein
VRKEGGFGKRDSRIREGDCSSHRNMLNMNLGKAMATAGIYGWKAVRELFEPTRGLDVEILRLSHPNKEVVMVFIINADSSIIRTLPRSECHLISDQFAVLSDHCSLRFQEHYKGSGTPAVFDQRTMHLLPLFLGPSAFVYINASGKQTRLKYQCRFLSLPYTAPCCVKMPFSAFVTSLSFPFLFTLRHTT